MRAFWKTFFAALTALFVFAVLVTIIGVVVIAGLASATEVKTGGNAVLVVDLANHFAEVEPADPLAELAGNKNSPPSLAKLIRLVAFAKNDESVKGIFIKASTNNNDYASSEELRQAIAGFRQSGKFVYAYGNNISLRAYYVAGSAGKIYCNPAGSVDWHGLSLQIPFIKGALEKLEVEPQIFYAGKFKSATEPLREKEMTEANRVQSRALLEDIFRLLLMNTSYARNIDTATLRQYAENEAIRFSHDAVRLGMIDGAKYDDEVKDEIRKELKIGKDEDINFIGTGKYADAVEFMPSGKDKIAVIYAEGDIRDGSGDRGTIGGDTYRNHIRKAREDHSIKAIVLRVNSGGGSSLASEIIWREVQLARQQKPVIVSFGDYAASGGYYMSCAADSIFAQPNTITGSIGVFSVIPNMQKFFNNKLGVTFDGVSTGGNATMATVTRPLSASQKRLFQNEVDTVYQVFLERVAAGRKIPLEFVDSIAQGRVWSGSRAVELGLVDRIGGLNEAIKAAAVKARISSYKLREYPGKQGLREMLFGDRESEIESAIKEELGIEGFKIYSFIRDIKQSVGKAQARLPFELIIE